MKVICKKCGGLVKEEEAIKMSQYDYECMNGYKREQNPFSVSIADFMFKQQVTICEQCYNRSNW